MVLRLFGIILAILLLFFVVSLTVLFIKVSIINDYEEYFSHHLKSIFVHTINFKNIGWLIATVALTCFVGISSGIMRSFEFYDDMENPILGAV